MSDAAPKIEIAGHPDVVRVLEQALAMARSGQIIGCAIVVTAGPGHHDISLAGRGPLELYFGLAKLQGAIEAQQDRPQSSIMRVRN